MEKPLHTHEGYVTAQPTFIFISKFSFRQGTFCDKKRFKLCFCAFRQSVTCNYINNVLFKPKKIAKLCLFHFTDTQIIIMHMCTRFGIILFDPVFRKTMDYSSFTAVCNEHRFILTLSGCMGRPKKHQGIHDYDRECYDRN